MRKTIQKNIRFFQAVKSMDKKKVARKLKERRQQHRKNRMVKEILGNMLVIRGSIFIFGVISVCFMMAIAAFVSFKQRKVIGMIMEPLHLVEQAMEEMAKGNLEFDIDYERRNEFGLLAEHLIETGERPLSRVYEDSAGEIIISRFYF